MNKKQKKEEKNGKSLKMPTFIANIIFELVVEQCPPITLMTSIVTKTRIVYSSVIAMQLQCLLEFAVVMVGNVLRIIWSLSYVIYKE